MVIDDLHHLFSDSESFVFIHPAISFTARGAVNSMKRNSRVFVRSFESGFNRVPGFRCSDVPGDKENFSPLMCSAFIAIRFKHDYRFQNSARMKQKLSHSSGDGLTFETRQGTLLLSCLKSQLAPPLPPRMRRAILVSSRILCSDLSLYRTPKLKPSWMQRNEPRSGNEHLRLPLRAALQATALRRGPFLPPCQSGQHKSAAFRQSVT